MDLVMLLSLTNDLFCFPRPLLSMCVSVLQAPTLSPYPCFQLTSLRNSPGGPGRPPGQSALGVALREEPGRSQGLTMVTKAPQLPHLACFPRVSGPHPLKQPGPVLSLHTAVQGEDTPYLERKVKGDANDVHPPAKSTYCSMRVGSYHF